MIARLPNTKLVNLKEFTVRDQITLNNTIELSGLEGSIRFLESFILDHSLNVFDKLCALILLRKYCIGDTIDINNVTIMIDTILEKLYQIPSIRQSFCGTFIDYPKEFLSADLLLSRVVEDNSKIAAANSKAIHQFVKKYNNPITLIQTKSLPEPIEVNFFDESAANFIVLLFGALSTPMVREYVYLLAQRTHDMQSLYSGTIADMMDYIDIQNRKNN